MKPTDYDYDHETYLELNGPESIGDSDQLTELEISLNSSDSNYGTNELSMLFGTSDRLNYNAPPNDVDTLKELLRFGYKSNPVDYLIAEKAEEIISTTTPHNFESVVFQLDELFDQEGLSGLNGNVFKKIGAGLKKAGNLIGKNLQAVTTLVASALPTGSFAQQLINSPKATSLIKNISASQVKQVASQLTPGQAAQLKEIERIIEKPVYIQQQSVPQPSEKKNNTLLYFGLGAGFLTLLGGIFLATRQRPIAGVGEKVKALGNQADTEYPIEKNIAA